ncbi:hypothetical protein J2X90_005580 [Variovorax paradoxus]|uniref:hypothetical protein n=1 Tax=Variovorax paradoxus TaxID=34073 RepID=UPI0027826983|nr:hypothetical protein [Variovorax paradoxus]MDQ0027744.1 hypothetical protein [Variovorax paradoxus]
MSQQFFDNRAAVEANLLAIEASLTQPIKDTEPTLRSRILAKAVVFLAEQIGKRTMELHRQLELRVQLLERRPTPPFFWEWSAGDEFTTGAFVTHRGCLWQCVTYANRTPPGTDASWKLIVGMPVEQ